ncbi:general substrate transporter [Dipodascopsis uninucleata]
MPSAEKPVDALPTLSGDHPPGKNHLVEDEQLVEAAKAAADFEAEMSLLQAVKLYPKAIAWSMFLSSALIMEGYDLVLLNSFYAFPEFLKKYGVLQADGSYQISASWQAGLSNGALIGEIIGLLITGVLAERIGYRWTLISNLIAICGFIFILFFAPNVAVLEVGQVLCGLPWGVFQSLTTTYAAEVCPVVLRAYLTTYVNLCWVFGQLTASGVLRGMLSRSDEWCYRIPFALQWVWPVPIMIGIYFAPESPWWLVRKGRIEEAVKSVKRLTRSNSSFDPDKSVAMMIHTTELERATSEGTSYLDCFKGTDLRRTEIVCVIWAIQVLCGQTLMNYSTYFFEQAGLNSDNSFSMTLGQYGLGAVGTLISWFLMIYWGRRTLHLIGMLSCFVALFAVGCISFAPAGSSSASWATGAMILVFTFFYDCSIGPVTYSIVSEIPSGRLRSKSVVLARSAYNIVGIINSVLSPYMINPTAWNWRGKTGFFWAGINFLFTIYVFFRLPEPKGRTYVELDMLFEQRVPARKFSKTRVNPYTEDLPGDADLKRDIETFENISQV